MKYLLTITLYFFFSASHADSSLVDPDSLDSSMPVVSYLIPASNLKIAAYQSGSPSKLQVKLCKICIRKIYQLSPEAELNIMGQPLEKTKLTEILLGKKVSQLRLAVNRSKGMIIYLYLGASPNDEFSSTPMPIINNPASTGGIK